MNIKKQLIEFFGTGRMPSGTLIASVIAAVIGTFVIMNIGLETLFMLLLLLSIVGVFEINNYLNAHTNATTATITLNTVVGTWLALLISFSSAIGYELPYAHWGAALLAVGGYMLFWQWRPSTIGWLLREVEGGLGIILASLLSGIAGGFLATLLLKGMSSFL